MFKTLCQNSEIHSFLSNFPPNSWKNVLEAVSLYGIRRFYSENLPLTLKTIQEILTPQICLKKTLSSMKNDLKNINSAIKRIERRTQSSADLHKDFNLSLTEKPKLQFFDSKPRNSFDSGEKKGNSSNVKRIDKFFGIKKEVEEPRICNLNDAQKIIKNVKNAIGIGEVNMSHDLFRSRASQSTQDNSPKGIKTRHSTVNFTFGM